MTTRALRFSAGVMGVLWVACLGLAAAAEPGLSVTLQSDRFSRTLSVGASAALDLSNVSGDIEITGVVGDTIQIDARKSGNPALVDIEVSQTGDRVRVETRYRGNRGPSVDFTVSVPSRTVVSVKSVSGDIDVRDVSGGVRAESVSGDVEVTNVGNLMLAKSVSGSLTIDAATSPEELEISSVSGDVSVTALKAEGVSVESVSGEVRLTDVACERASVESVSGDIHYGGQLATSGRYEFQSHSGDVTLALAGDTGFELAAETFSGEVSSDFPMTAGRLRGKDVHGVFGDGSAMIQASTFSGDISLTKN